MSRALVLLLLLPPLAVATPAHAQTLQTCTGCGFWMEWNASTVRLDIGIGLRRLTLANLSQRWNPDEEPMEVPWPYMLVFGECPPEGFCHPPFAHEFKPYSYEFLSHGWIPSWDDTSFTLTNPTGSAVETLYLWDPISFDYGPTVPWDLSSATVITESVSPEPAPLALVATGLLALVGLGAGRRTRAHV